MSLKSWFEKNHQDPTKRKLTSWPMPAQAPMSTSMLSIAIAICGAAAAAAPAVMACLRQSVLTGWECWESESVVQTFFLHVMDTALILAGFQSLKQLWIQHVRSNTRTCLKMSQDVALIHCIQISTLQATHWWPLRNRILFVWHSSGSIHHRGNWLIKKIYVRHCQSLYWHRLLSYITKNILHQSDHFIHSSRVHIAFDIWILNLWTFLE